MIDVINDFAKWLSKRGKVEQPKIEFYSSVEGIEKWAPIVPASKYIPNWYKQLPAQKVHTYEEIRGMSDATKTFLPTGNPPEWRTAGQTIKTCPGIQDYLTNGFIVPFWGSAMLEISANGNSAVAVTSSALAQYYPDGADGKSTGNNADFVNLDVMTRDSDITAWQEMIAYMRGHGFTEEEIGDWTKNQKTHSSSWDFGAHPQYQYSTMINEWPDEWAKVVLKLNSPWRIMTPPGYSTMITNLDYHFDTQQLFSVLPGIINTDYYRTFNMFMHFKTRGCKFLIPFQQPLCRYIMIKRTDLPFEVRTMTKEDEQAEREKMNLLNTNWGSSKPYRLMGKIFNKGKGGGCPFNH